LRSVLGRSFERPNPDALCRLVPEGDFQAIHEVNRGIAGRRAAQRRYLRVGHKTHMHQVVLDRLRQVEGNQDAALANG
jgi:hypothetical protein